MIRIHRDRQDEGGASICPEISWFEQASTVTGLARREAGAHRVRRDVYGDPQVHTALEKLFHDKCAYCESRITPGFDWEVEHFRPKKGVAERPDHPGYYWLAYEWSNLYPSCTLCNRRRRDHPRWGDCSLATTGGKGTQFPLQEETLRAMSPEDDLSLEKPLLLDPCRDSPEEFLSYNVTGEVVNLSDNPRGEATIGIFHLNRRRLRDLRRRVVAGVVDYLGLLEAKREEISDAARADLQDWLDRNYLGEDCEYAAVARAVLRDPAAFGLS